MRGLIRAGVLARPRCFEPEVEDADCEEAREKTPLDWWPSLGSGTPDRVMSRQLGGHGQCFHFMADAPDQLTALEPELGVPSGLVHGAFDRCLRTLGSLLEETLVDPVAARGRHRGVYVLMHAIQDSYSSAHVERRGGGTGPVLFLKSWRLRHYVFFLLRGKLRMSKRTTHRVIDARDDDYLRRGMVVGDKRCEEYANPYGMPEQCLTPPADRAATAVVNLLEAISRMMSVPEDKRSLDHAKVAAEWRWFLAVHFANPRAPAVGGKLAGGLEEWTPNILVGLRARPEFASLMFTSMQPRALTLPFVPAQTIEVGRREGDDPGWDARVELGLTAAIFDRITLGFAPLTARVFCDDGAGVDGCTFDMRMTPVRLTVFPWRGLWIDLASPSWSWTARSWQGRDASLSVGWAWDVNTLFVAKRDKLRFGKGRWVPPTVYSDTLRRKKSISRLIFAATTVGSTYRDQLVGLGIEARWDRDRYDRRSGLGAGLQMSVLHGASDDRSVSLVAGALVGRWYLLPGTLALTLAPVAGVVGQRQPDELRWDVGGQVGVSVTAGNLEVALDSSRLSYVAPEDFSPWPLYLRVGFLF